MAIARTSNPEDEQNEAVTPDEIKPSIQTTTPPRSTEFDYLWNEKLTLRDNIILIFKSYVPYSFNIFSMKHEVQRAQEIILQLDKLSDFKETYLRIFELLKHVNESFNPANPEGEFSRKLNYTIARIQYEHPLVEKAYNQKIAKDLVAKSSKMKTA